MTTKTIDLESTSATLEDILALVDSQEAVAVIIMRGNKQLARFESFHDPVSNQPRISPLHPGNFVMHDDFDDPLPDEFWLGQS